MPRWRKPGSPWGSRSVSRVLFIFLDGVGIGAPDPERNPFLTARLPTLTHLLKGRLPTLSEPFIDAGGCMAFPLDATLGVEGLPQSGTGQIALLTGENAAKIFGRHFGPWAPVKLRTLLLEQNVVSRARRLGYSVAFANAYPEGFGQGRRDRRLAATPLVARETGLMVRHAAELARGEAVASEITNSGWRHHLGHTEVPEISPAQAGRNLARLADEADLTFFAHYSTDQAGHKGGMGGAIESLERVDAFLGGVVDALAGDVSLIIASDHGNIEDVTEGHTRNPVLGIIRGHRSVLAGPIPSSIMDVPSAILTLLGAN